MSLLFRIDRRLVSVAAPGQVNNLQVPHQPPAEGTAPLHGEQSFAAVPVQESQTSLNAIVQAQEQAKARAEAQALEEAQDKAKAEADELLDKARQQAEEILRQARQDADDLRTQAQSLHAEAKTLQDKAHRTAEEAEAQLTAARHKLEQADDMCAQKLAGADAEVKERLQKADMEGLELRGEAWQKGFEEGKAEAAEDNRRQAESHTESLRGLLAQIETERTRMFDEFEGEIIRLSLSVAKKIINTALENDETAYETMIRHALNNMKREGKVTIRVSREEYRRFFASGAATFTLADGEVMATILDDPQLEPWDLLLESEMEILDAGAETQMRAITIAFERAVAAGRATADGEESHE